MNSRLLKRLLFWTKVACNHQNLSRMTIGTSFGGYEGRTIDYEQDKRIETKSKLLVRADCSFLAFFVSFCLLSFFSCQQETITPTIEAAAGFKKGVFITNEGQFTSGNASVTFYDVDQQTVQEKIFSAANDQPLGDVLQSITVVENKAYLILNNSQKIEIVNTTDFNSIKPFDDIDHESY